MPRLSLCGRVHPIVVTLGTMTIYRGLLISLTGGDTITDLPGAICRLVEHCALLGVNGSIAAGRGHGRWWSTCGSAHLRSGRHVMALGSSPTAARLVGISRARTWLVAFGAGGFLAALAGLLELSQTGAMQSGMGTGYELQAIAAAVIGGVSISGGRGSVVGVCLGALLLSLIYNALVLWQISRYHYALVTGGTAAGGRAGRSGLAEARAMNASRRAATAALSAARRAAWWRPLRWSSRKPIARRPCSTCGGPGAKSARWRP